MTMVARGAVLATLLGGGAMAADADGTRVLVALGDSLTAGYRLAEADAFPARLQAALLARGARVRIINAGNSGDTAAEGLARFDWAVPPEADGIIVELGANDGLRGLPPAALQTALTTIVARAKERGLAVLLTGMQAPGNWGEAYRQQFAAVYPAVAQAQGVPLHPFFLEGVAMDGSLNLDDGLHPNPAGVARIVEGILPAVERLLATIKESR